MCAALPTEVDPDYIGRNHRASVPSRQSFVHRSERVVRVIAHLSFDEVGATEPDTQEQGFRQMLSVGPHLGPDREYRREGVLPGSVLKVR